MTAAPSLAIAAGFRRRPREPRIIMGKREERPNEAGRVVMHYCHDTYGLGHLSRTRALARQLRRQRPGLSQLIVTGSPVPQHLLGAEDAEGIDFVKLPSVVKVGAERYEARAMAAPFAAVRDMRADILASAARHLRPDVLVVDHAPIGLKGEVLPTLRHLRDQSPGTRLVLGLRDIVDDPEAVRRVWAATGVYDVLDHVYDRILVYGERDVYDVARAYRLSDRAARKLRYVGYLAHRLPGPNAPPVAVRHAGLTDRLVVVTAGGGGDGYPLLSTMIDALQSRPGPPAFDCRLVLGPLMAPADAARLKARAAGLAGVEVVEFDPWLEATVAAADGVVAMGGYNTVCEILAHDRPAVIVPRVEPRREQWIRARILSRRGLVWMLHPDDLAPGRLWEAIDRMIAQPDRPRLPVALDGLETAAAEIEALLAPEARPGRLAAANGRPEIAPPAPLTRDFLAPLTT